MEKYSDRTRLDNSKKNIKFATIFQLSAAGLGFVERAFFINYLSSEYLGLKGLIMSILMVLTITEYGISSSLAYYLYKPLVNEDIAKIKATIRYIRKVYNTLTLFVLILGFALLFIFPTIANTSDIDSFKLRMYFIIYLIGTAISLKFSYHAIIIQAAQKQYITTIYISSAQLIQLVLQIFVLIFTQNFYLYALMFALSNGLKFVFVRKKSLSMFEFLKGKKKNFPSLDLLTLKKIKKDTMVLIFHKMNFSITMTIECVLMSYILGASVLGIFTNYQLVILGLASGIAILQKSFESSIGNLCTLESVEHAYTWFLKINHVCSLSIAFLCCLLFSGFTLFFKIVYPKAAYFDVTTTALIVLTQYFLYKRLIVTIFESSYGIFSQDKIKPFLQTFLSIILSYLLCIKFGVKGIFSGIIISEILTSTWIEPYKVHKLKFKKSLKPYYIDFAKNLFIMIVSASITYYLSTKFTTHPIIDFIIIQIINIVSFILVLSIVFPENGKSIIKWIFKKHKKEDQLSAYIDKIK